MVTAAENPSIAFQQMISGGIVNSRTVALKMAELLIESLYGPEELQRQAPLSVSETPENWIIEGAYNSDRKEEGFGKVSITIKKRDAQVIDLKREFISFPPPDVREIIKKSQKQ